MAHAGATVPKVAAATRVGPMVATPPDNMVRRGLADSRVADPTAEARPHPAVMAVTAEARVAVTMPVPAGLAATMAARAGSTVVEAVDFMAAAEGSMVVEVVDPTVAADTANSLVLFKTAPPARAALVFSP